MKKTFFSITLAALFSIIACKKEEVSATKYDCAGSTPTYEKNVKAILDKSCAFSGCHAAANSADGIDLSSYAKVKAEAAKSAFLGSIEHASGYDKMPKGGNKLPDADIKTIACWIQNGYLEK
jgi:hypothetical protein